MDLEKKGHATEIESSGYRLSNVATQDKDAVVTAKTWAVVVVSCYNVLASENDSKFSSGARCFIRYLILAGAIL